MITRQFLKNLQTCAMGALVCSSISMNAAAGAMCSSCTVPYTWNGVYAGLQAGYSWNKLNWTFNNPNFFNTDGIFVYTPELELKADGFAGGGNIGYNYQNDDWIIGLEVAILGMDAKRSVMSPIFPLTDRFSTSTKWLSTAKARAGHAHQDWLAFISGGWAGGDVSLTMADALDNVVASSNKWVNGWTLGGGIEYRLNESLSFGLGYEYIRLTANDLTLPCNGCAGIFPGVSPIVKATTNKQIVAARLNYYLDEMYY